MKTTIRKNIYLTLLVMVTVLSSCNGFLDKMPDNRAELDSEEKVSQLLVSAYPKATYVQMAELMTDNVTDNGPLYTTYTKSVEESYKWQDYTNNQQDTPQFLWDEFYKAVAAANHALEFINSTDNPEDYAAHRGEALICRAYAHFILVNIFSQHYNTITGHTDLGIPYVEMPEKIVSGHYERGTVAQTYEKIYQDIEEALPLISDSKYKKNVIKYHFNQKAAYAFAARFNLYYEKYDKVIEYATKALGNNPEKVLRDYNTIFESLSSNKDCGIAYIKAELPCNLLLISSYSSWTNNHWGRNTWYRYAHNMKKLEETLAGPGPWLILDYFRPTDKLFGGDEVAYFPKYNSFMEYTDVIAGIGYMNIINTAFTTDEVLLCRAEAYIHKKDYANATRDLAYWYHSHTTDVVPGLTENRIDSYYESANKILRPGLNPKFTIEKGKQENFFYCVLHFRRCETLHEGLRWFDIKRFGIEVIHPVYGEKEDVLTKDDLRRAVQIPADVVSAGMQPNPR